MCVCLYEYIYIYHMPTVHQEARIGQQMPWYWSYRVLGLNLYPLQEQ